MGRRVGAAEAARIAAEFARRARYRTPRGWARPRLEPVGSLRRGEAGPASDVDLLATVPAGDLRVALPALELRPRRAGDRLEALPGGAAGPRRRAFGVRAAGRRVVVDLFAATPAERAYALFHYTGPRSYNVRTRAHAKRQGLRLNQYGLFVAASGRRARASAARSEREVAARIGVRYRAPAARR